MQFFQNWMIFLPQKQEKMNNTEALFNSFSEWIVFLQSIYMGSTPGIFMEFTSKHKCTFYNAIVAKIISCPRAKKYINESHEKTVIPSAHRQRKQILVTL